MTNDASHPIYDCIVLGAGIAGVTAARNLQEKGLRVLLLEGAHRIGGRMYSKRAFVRNPDYVPRRENREEKGKYIPVEAGAEYIHVGEKERYKEFWDEINRHGFSTSQFHKSGSLLPPEMPRNRVFFPFFERTVPTLVSLLDPEVLGMVGLLFDLQRFDPTDEEDVPARAFAHSKDYRGRGMSMAEYTLSAHTPGLLDERTDTISVGGISVDRIPDQFLESAEFRLEREQRWEHTICGYDTLPNEIAREFRSLGGTVKKSDDGTTHMKVSKVERSGDGIITVKTHGGEQFAGHSAICTFSVGMLDPETGEGAGIFGDLLPKAKRTALGTVKMGPITKLSLEFKERKWKTGGPWASHMSVLSNPEGDARTFFSSFPDHQDGPHVLTALLMSKDHEKIKDKNDADAVQHLLDVLQEIYDPDGNRWTPEEVLVGTRDAHGAFLPSYLRQDWSKDEFAKGGNSFVRFVPTAERRMEVTEVREALKNPNETLPLFWAGEATAPAYDRNYQPLSVHGAYISGVRVAEDVYHFLRVCETDAQRFAAYYEEKYTHREEEPSAGDFDFDDDPEAVG
ncbi:MAG: flavin monoamine oxidase family protein [Candidatus Methylomirabilales bacterium]